MRIKQPAFMRCMRGVTIIRPNTYDQAQVVDVYGLIPVCHETHGYCWPTSFKVLGVLYLEEVSSTFLPSKKAC
jgi:hypothetical protein